MTVHILDCCGLLRTLFFYLSVLEHNVCALYQLRRVQALTDSYCPLNVLMCQLEKKISLPGILKKIWLITCTCWLHDWLAACIIWDLLIWMTPTHYKLRSLWWMTDSAFLFGHYQTGSKPKFIECLADHHRQLLDIIPLGILQLCSTDHIRKGHHYRSNQQIESNMAVW